MDRVLQLDPQRCGQVSQFTSVLGTSRTCNTNLNPGRCWNGLHALMRTYGKPTACPQSISAVCKVISCSHLGTLCKTPDAMHASNAKSFASALYTWWRVLMFFDTAIL